MTDEPDTTAAGDPRLWGRAQGRKVFDELIELALAKDVSATKLAAIKEALDRGYGRTAQAAAPPEEPIVEGRRGVTCQSDPSKAVPDPSRR